jgi:Spy/CpxP family protein refolding chaperone
MRLWTTVGVLVVAGAVVAAAQGRPGREGRPGPEVRPARTDLRAQLGLSADQAAQIEKIRSEARKQAIRQRADLAVARLELRELMNAPTVDEKAVSAKVKAISDLQAAGLKAWTDERLAMRRILTPEQQEKMRQLVRERWRERGPRPGRGWRQRGAGAPFGPAGGPPDEGDDPPSPGAR